MYRGRQMSSLDQLLSDIEKRFEATDAFSPIYPKEYKKSKEDFPKLLSAVKVLAKSMEKSKAARSQQMFEGSTHEFMCVMKMIFIDQDEALSKAKDILK